MNLLFLLLPVAVLGLWMWWNRPAQILRALGAKPANARDHSALLALVEELARLVRQPKPKIFLISEFSPNVILLSRFRSPLELVISDGLLRAFTEEELRALILLSLCQGNGSGRWLHTRLVAAIFPLTKRLQRFSLFSQFLVAPTICSFFWFFTSSAKVAKTDALAAQVMAGWKIAAALQKLSVLGRKITWKRWDLSLDSLYLVSPLVLEGGPLATFVPQPSIEERRAFLLQSTACETAASLS
jgi:Zn-dependent protease with chaperone function